MNVSPEDARIVQAWITKKCGQLQCFCCGLSKWQLSATTLMIGYDARTTQIYYSQGVPSVTLACENCAHLVSFSAIIMGLKHNEPEALSIEGNTSLQPKTE